VNGAIQHLRAEILSDVRAFESRVDELERTDLTGCTDDAMLAKAAVALHHAYGAIEGALTRVTKFFDGDAPSGSEWHQELLRTMSLEIPGIRPAILGEASVRGLRSLLGFRHFFRHAYAVAWDADRLASLRRDALRLRLPLCEDFRRLDDLLARVADSASS